MKITDIFANVAENYPLHESVIQVHYQSNRQTSTTAFTAISNPSMAQIETMIGKSAHRSLRGIVADNTVFVWDSSLGNHLYTAEALGFDPATFRGYAGPTSFWIVEPSGHLEHDVWEGPQRFAANGLGLTYESGKDTADCPAFKKLLRQFKPTVTA